MAESNHYGLDSNGDFGDAFRLNTRTIIAIGEAIQALPAIKKLLSEMIDGVVHPDGANGKLHGAKLDTIRQWIWDGKPGVSRRVPEFLIILLIALDNTID